MVYFENWFILQFPLKALKQQQHFVVTKRIQREFQSIVEHRKTYYWLDRRCCRRWYRNQKFNPMLSYSFYLFSRRRVPLIEWTWMMRGAWTGNTRYKRGGGREGVSNHRRATEWKKKERETVNFKRELSEIYEEAKGAIRPFSSPWKSGIYCPIIWNEPYPLSLPPPLVKQRVYDVIRGQRQKSYAQR